MTLIIFAQIELHSMTNLEMSPEFVIVVNGGTFNSAFTNYLATVTSFSIVHND